MEIPDTATPTKERHLLDLDWVMLAALVCLSAVAVVSMVVGYADIARIIAAGIVGALFRSARPT